MSVNNKNMELALEKKVLQLDNVQRIRDTGGISSWTKMPEFAEIETVMNLKLSRVPVEQGFYIYISEDENAGKFFKKASFYYKYKNNNIEIPLSEEETHLLVDSYRRFLLSHYVLLPPEFDENAPVREV